jgi:ubiquinone/menaquinone biosynthesis C-methylase UbiE
MVPPAQRDSRELISEMIGSVLPNGRVLDLGCGPKDQAKPIESVGYRYVGVDYSSSLADLLADARSIPFRDSTFECVFSYAVLEHLHSPFLAIRKIERVLSPNGLFVGTVSQGELSRILFSSYCLGAREFGGINDNTAVVSGVVRSRDAAIAGNDGSIPKGHSDLVGRS